VYFEEPKRILVVDDDPVVRGLIIVALADAGHRVDGAVDNEACWDALLNRPYDLSMTDDAMSRTPRGPPLEAVRGAWPSVALYPYHRNTCGCNKGADPNRA